MDSRQEDWPVIFSQAALDKRDRSVNFHTHPGIEMILVTEGRGEIVVGDAVCDCRAGTLVIIPPETMHNQVCKGHLLNSFIGFFCAPDFFDGSFRSLDVSSEPWCEHLFRDVCRMSEETRYELCEGVLRALLTCITRLEEKQMGHDSLHPALRKALEKLDSDFRMEISLEQLALDCGVSYSYLRKLFDRHFRFSPMRYLQNCRMAHARKLLLNSYSSITDIAACCGYPDNNYFTRLFRQIHRCSPNEYRKVMRDRPPASGPTFIRM